MDKQHLSKYLESNSHTDGHNTVRRLVTSRDGSDTLDLVYDYAINRLSIRWNDSAQQPVNDYEKTMKTPFFCNPNLIPDIPGAKAFDATEGN